MLLWLWACSAEDVKEVEPPAPLRFSVPLAEPERIYQSTGVDHDPEVQSNPIAQVVCTSYDGRAFPWCYDEHRGTDYLLEGGFGAMDHGSTPVLAAADGEVISTEDGHYDRCHVDVEASGGISCDGNEVIANHVKIEHFDGTISMYWHLANGSLLVEVGDQVACGEPLGLVGSSGFSSSPHLHFQVERNEEVIDPYAGEFSQDESLWAEQGSPTELPKSACP